MNKKALALLVLFVCPLVAQSQAEIKHIEMRVEGMTWNFWAYGVQQSLKRQAGVQKVVVSLRDGTADITPKEDGRIDPAALLKATYDSGVSVTELDMTVRGKIVKNASGNLALQAEPNELFTLAPNALSESLAPLAGSATQVTVRGQLYKRIGKKKQKPDASTLKLLVLQIQKKE